MSSKRSGKELQNKNIEQLDPGLSTCLNLRSRLEQGQAAFPPSSKSALRLTGLQTTICPLLGPGGCLTLHRQRMKVVPFGRLSVLGLGFHGKMVMGKWLALVPHPHSWHTCHRYIGPKFKCQRSLRPDTDLSCGHQWVFTPLF